MRVVTREQFLQMPLGTIYAKGEPWHFGRIQVKQASLTDDWQYIDPCGVESSGPDQMYDLFAEMRDNGTSYPMNAVVTRNGGFDADELFLVWERADLIRLRSMVEEAISACPTMEPMGIKGAVQETSPV